MVQTSKGGREHHKNSNLNSNSWSEAFFWRGCEEKKDTNRELVLISKLVLICYFKTLVLITPPPSSKKCGMHGNNAKNCILSDLVILENNITFAFKLQNFL